MRVAILGIKTLPAFAGADRVVERLLDHMPQHDATIYLVRDARPRLSCTENRHYVYIPALPGKHLRAFSFFLLSTIHYLLKGRADVVHVHNSDFGLFVPFLRLRSAPVVGTSHAHPYDRAKWGRSARLFLRAAERAFIRYCDLVTCVARSHADEAPSLIHIPNGVDEHVVDRPAAARVLSSIGVDEGRYVLFACGRLDATKGLHHLFEAYQLVQGDDPLLVIGDFGHDSSYSRVVEQMASRDPRVRLHRSLLPREDLLALLHHSRVFVFPSEVEAMSMLLLEAVSACALTVCSDIAENRAVVGDTYPLQFRSGDSEALGQVLRFALALDGGRRDEVVAAAAKAASEYRWPQISERYTEAYRAVLAQPNSPTPATLSKKEVID